MEEASLFSLPEGMRVEHIQITEQGLVIEVEASHPISCCPLCTQTSDSIKSHYRRMLRDAPCAGRQVQLVLTMRKFYCRNPYCSQKVWLMLTSVAYCSLATSIEQELFLDSMLFVLSK